MFSGKPIGKSVRKQVSSKSHNAHYNSDKANIIHASCFNYCKYIFGTLKYHMNYANMKRAFLKWCTVADSNAPN